MTVACLRHCEVHFTRTVPVELGGPTPYSDLTPIPERLGRRFDIEVWDPDRQRVDGLAYCPAHCTVSETITHLGVWSPDETTLALTVLDGHPGARMFDFGCVDASTEYLSPNGWRRMDEYDGGPVMQYHHPTGMADFVSPVAYIRRSQSEFLALRTKYGVNQWLTPDHRVLCWRLVGGDRRQVPMVLTAAEFAKKQERLKLGFQARFETTFQPLISTQLPLDDDQLRVQVMFMADGCLRSSRRGVVAVLKERKVDRARKLLTVADIPFVEKIGSNGATTFTFRPPMPVKTYAGFWAASADQLRVIADECLHWDGSASKRMFYSRDRASADFIHYAFSACGWRSVLTEREETGKPYYQVSALANTRVGLAGNPKSEIETVASEDGLAYCFQVPSGFLVLRRGGNIFVTGNCHVGWFTLLAASCSAQVTAFEADEDNLDLLVASVARNGWADRVDARHLFVDATTPVLPADGMVRFVKIDVEGAEADAVRMLGPLLDAGMVDHLLVEVSPVFCGGYPELVVGLVERGFRAFLLPPKQRPPVDLADPASALVPYRLDTMSRADLAALVASWDQSDVWFVREGAEW